MTPKSSYAQTGCVTSSGSCSGTTPFTCSVTVKSHTYTACCSSGPACTTYRQTAFSQKANLSWDPTGSCSNGIDTALGCLPYDANGGLGSILLTFSAGIVGAIALVIMLAGTITIMTAGGNPEQVKKGKELLTGAITGLLFIIFSVTLLRLVAGDIIKLDNF